MTVGLVRLPDGRELRRAEAEEYLALLRERDRRLEARRIAAEREEIMARCWSLHGFIKEFWRVLEPVALFRTGWALEAMCDHLEAVTEGHIRRNLKARVLRDDVILYNGSIASLRRFKDDVTQVEKGYECGIGLDNFQDIQVGDVIETFELEERLREL